MRSLPRYPHRYVRLTVHGLARIVRELAPFTGAKARLEIHFNVAGGGHSIAVTTVGEAEQSLDVLSELRPYAVAIGAVGMETL
jgi:hypothetical protein